MRDQRVERGPAFRHIEPRHRFAVGGIGAQAIDGLGRKRREAAARQAAGRRGDGLGVGSKELRFGLDRHACPHACSLGDPRL